MKTLKKVFILIMSVLFSLGSCSRSGTDGVKSDICISGSYFTSHEINVPEGMMYYQNISCVGDSIYVTGVSAVTQSKKYLFSFDTEKKTLSEIDITGLSDANITALYNYQDHVMSGSRNGCISLDGKDIFRLPQGQSAKSFYLDENDLLIISTDSNNNYYAQIYDRNTYVKKSDYDFSELCEMDYGEYFLNAVYADGLFCIITEKYQNNIRSNVLYRVSLDDTETEKAENILPDTEGYYENSYINMNGNICIIFREFSDSSHISIDEIEIASGKSAGFYEDTFSDESIMILSGISENYDFVFWDDGEIFGYDADNVRKIKIFDRSYSSMVLPYCSRASYNDCKMYFYSEDIKTLDSPVMIEIDSNGVLQNKISSSDYINNGWAENMIRLSDGSICISEYDGEKYSVSVTDESGVLINTIYPAGENDEVITGNIYAGQENEFYFIQKYNDHGTKIRFSVFDVTGKLLRNAVISENAENMTIKGAFRYTDKDYFIYEYFDSDSVCSFASEIDYSSGILKNQILSGIRGVCDSDQNLCYYTDDGILNYFSEDPEIIVNWLDSDIINPVSIVCRKNENRYYCVTNDQTGLHLLQLDRADEQTLQKLKNKKTITLAGVDLQIGYINAEIEKFNNTNNNYRIKVTDYKESLSEQGYESGVNQMNLDIISGKIPDIFIGNADLDLKIYSSKGLFTDLNEFLKKDESFIRSDYLENILDCFCYDGKQLMFPLKFRLYSVVGQSGVLGEKKGWTYDEFFEAAKTRNIFWDPTYDLLSEVLIYSNISDFVDYDKKKCSFDTETFKKIIEYISENGSEDLSGDTRSEAYFRRYQDGSCCAQIMNTSNIGAVAKIQNGDMEGEKISYKGVPVSEGNGVLAVPYPIIAISEQSENKEGAWEFVKQLISDEYQDKELAFPVKKSAFEKYIRQTRFSSAYVERADGSVYKTKPLTDDDIRDFSQAVNNIDHIYSTDRVVSEIISEQLILYLNNEQTSSETVDNIQYKVSCYLSEIK